MNKVKIVEELSSIEALSISLAMMGLDLLILGKREGKLEYKNKYYLVKVYDSKKVIAQSDDDIIKFDFIDYQDMDKKVRELFK